MGESVESKTYSEDEQQALRLRVDAVRNAEKLSLPQLSLQSGNGESTVSAWLGGKYTGNNHKVAAKFDRWLAGRDAAARTRAALPEAPKFTPTPTSDLIWAAFEQAHFGPDMVQMTGAPGIGKTETCRAYASRFTNVWMITGEPSMPSVAAVLVKIFQAAGITEKFSGTMASSVVIRRLSQTNGLLIVDEAQHFSTQAIDQLRTIHDLAEIGVALVGNETVASRLEGEGRLTQHAQLYSRIGRRLTRPKAVRRDIEALLDAWEIEDQAQRKMLVAIGLQPGALRNVTKSLRHAHMHARGADQALSVEHIKQAWVSLGGRAGVVEA